MHKQEITFTDFNDVTRTVTEYFNLSESEIAELQAQSERGIEVEWKEAAETLNTRKLYEIMIDLIRRSYGKKSEDGMYFRKNAQITEDFINSAVYDAFVVSLFENDGAGAIDFIKAIFPKKIVDRAGEAFSGIAAGAVIPEVAPSARENFERLRQQVPPEHFQPETATQPATPSDEQFQEFLRWKENGGVIGGPADAHS